MESEPEATPNGFNNKSKVMFFINLIFAISPVLGFSAPQPLAAEQEEYCNERFEFCVTYPDDYFTEKTYADNGDGVTMTVDNGRIEVDVMGAYNVMNWFVEDIINSYFKTIQEKPMEVQLSEIVADQTSGWATMTYNYEIQYFYVSMWNDSYITMIITVPASQPETLDLLKQEVQLTFPLPANVAGGQ